jgi:hypothetical protein
MTTSSFAILHKSRNGDAANMNWLDFFASVIQSLVSLAWPAALVICIWMFREKIAPLLPLLHLRHKDTEIRFVEAQKEAQQLPAPSGDIKPTPEEVDRYLEIAKLSPNAAILSVRRNLEAAVARLLQSLSLAKQPMGYAVRRLRHRNIIDPHTSALLDDLIAIGNRAAHDQSNEMSLTDALNYRDLAERAIAALSQIAPDKTQRAISPSLEPDEDQLAERNSR